MVSPVASAVAPAQSKPVTQPALPMTMPPHRVDAFVRMIAARLRENTPIETLVAEQRAMASALTNPAFVAAAVDGFVQAMRAEQPNDRYPLSPEEARREIDSILKNRVSDAEQFAALLAQPEFVARAQAEAKTTAPAPSAYALPPGKAGEIVRRLVQPTDADGPEPAVHVAASALGQRVVHQALASIFHHDGPLHKPLMDALKQAHPGFSEDAAHKQTNAWLLARYNPALAVADGLKPEGAIYQSAMKLAEELQRRKLAGELPAVRARIAATSALTPVPLSPAEIEAKKSRQAKAEDVIYTLNHAITCLGITDTFVGPWLGAASEKLFGKNLWEHGHDHHDHDGHDHGPHDGHGHHGEKLGFWKRLSSWVISEFIGDAGAVPVTIAAQRWAPGFMHGLRRIMEPMVGGIFRRRAESSARNWGETRGFAYDSQEVVDRAHELYEYEVSHLPQMAVWTVASVGLNYGAMKAMRPDMPASTFLKGKALGAATTAALVFGARAFSPSTAHAWDAMVGKNVISPLTKKVGHVFGIDPENVDTFHANHTSGALPAVSIQGLKQYAGAVMGSPVMLRTAAVG